VTHTNNLKKMKGQKCEKNENINNKQIYKRMMNIFIIIFLIDFTKLKCKTKKNSRLKFEIQIEKKVTFNW